MTDLVSGFAMISSTNASFGWKFNRLYCNGVMVARVVPVGSRIVGWWATQYVDTDTAPARALHRTSKRARKAVERRFGIKLTT